MDWHRQSNKCFWMSKEKAVSNNDNLRWEKISCEQLTNVFRLVPLLKVSQFTNHLLIFVVIHEIWKSSYNFNWSHQKNNMLFIKWDTYIPSNMSWKLSRNILWYFFQVISKQNLLNQIWKYRKCLKEIACLKILEAF